jgi:hypothetical protein
MAETRIKVADEKEFDERECLRREVLWSSLVIPYEDLMESWDKGIEYHYYDSNESRAGVYEKNSESPEDQANVFFNRGKKIATVIASAVLFRARSKEIELPQLYDSTGVPTHDNLSLQARNVDMVLGKITIRNLAEPLKSSDEDAYSSTEHVYQLANRSENPFAKRRLFLRAGKIMSRLAIKEVGTWRKTAVQNSEGSLPALTIQNGGHPRSAGPRVEMLQPVFHEIVQSDEFKSL